MFSLVSGLYESYLAPVTLNILIVGPPGAGKTAVLERLKGTQLPKRAPSSSSSSRGTDAIHPIPQSVVRALVDTSGLTSIDEVPSDTLETPSSIANTKNSDTAAAVNSSANSAVSSSSSALLPPIVVTQRKRRFFPVSICPAPERYQRAAAVADEDEEFVYDDEEEDDDDEEDETEDDHPSKQNDDQLPQTESGQEAEKDANNTDPNDKTDGDQQGEDTGMTTIPLEAPIISNAPRRLRLHSREFSVESLDLSKEDINEYTKEELDQKMQKSKSKKKKKNKKRNKGEPPKAASTGIGNSSTAKHQCPLHQKSSQNYDVKPNGKLLPMSKIRPTIGTNLAKLEMYGAMCHFFDVGGKMQSLWDKYYSDCDAVIFCWKVQDDPDVASKDDNPNDDDSDDPPPFDMKLQQELLHQVRQSIPDDVPFLVLGHVFGNVHEGIVNRMYNTTMLLPRYHNPITAMCCGSAKTGAGIVYAMDWLVPLAKRLQKERVGRATLQPKEV